MKYYIIFYIVFVYLQKNNKKIKNINKKLKIL